MDDPIFLDLKTRDLTLSKLKSWLAESVGEDKAAALVDKFHTESYEEVRKMQRE